jgi:ABC-type lipoprotein release transport system permease subunit
LSEIKIVAVLNDMIDAPRMFLSLPLAQKILQKQAIQGLHARVKNFDRLQIIRDSISKKLDPGVRVSSWVDGQNRQQKLFSVFDSIFWIIAVAILTLSVITGMLGIYRAFMTKRGSIAILLLLGVSKRTFYWMLASITEISLLGGVGLASLLFFSGYETLNEQLLLSVQAMSPVESPELPLQLFFYWNGGMFILYSVLSLIFLKVILNTRISLS